MGEPLSPATSAAKLAALREHRTEYRSDGELLRRFVRRNELFGELPPLVLGPRSTATVGAAAVQGLAWPEMPTEVTEAEGRLFSHVQRTALRRRADTLEVTLILSGPPQRETRVFLDLFGYRPGRAFAETPKAQVRLAAGSVALFDGAEKLSSQRITSTWAASGIELHVPLAALGQPDRILVKVRSYAGELPLDASPWQVVMLR